MSKTRFFNGIKVNDLLIDQNKIINVGKINFKNAIETTLLNDAFTVTSQFHKILGENGSSDDLSSINGGSAGDILYLYPGNSNQKITIKHGIGNIITSTSEDYEIPENTFVILYFDGSYWRLQITGGAHIILDEGTNVADQDSLNFVGFELQSDSVNERINISLPDTCYVRTFTNSDLVNNKITLIHNLNQTYGLNVNLWDDNNNLKVPDNVQAISNNQVEIDLSSYVPISNTWSASVIKCGGNPIHKVELEHMEYICDGTESSITFDITQLESSDLKIILNVKSKYTGEDILYARFNNDNGNNYDNISFMKASDSGVLDPSSDGSDQSQLYIQHISGGNAPTDFYSNIIMDLNYVNRKDYYRGVICSGMKHDGNKAYMIQTNSIWKNNTSKIETITFFLNSGSNFEVDSRIKIYGKFSNVSSFDKRLAKKYALIFST